MNETIAKRKSEITQGLAQAYINKSAIEEDIIRLKAVYHELEQLEKPETPPHDPPPIQGR